MKKRDESYGEKIALAILKITYEALFYIPAIVVIYFVFKFIIFVPIFALKEYLGYEVITRTGLKIIAFFLANVLLVSKIIFSTRVTDKYSKRREKIRMVVAVKYRDNGRKTYYINRKEAE